MMKLRVKPKPNFRTDLDLQRQVLVVPEHVIIDVSRPVNSMAAMFQYSPEYLLHEMIDAISDRVTVGRNLNRLGRHLQPVVADVPSFGQHGFIDRMITIEQTALDIADYMEQMRLYLYGRYLPYRFETLMNDGSLLLKRVENYQEFCDRITTDLGFNEGET